MKQLQSRGFSLLEVLIALVILSVGLLGLAALQAEGLRNSSLAQTRFQAVRLASDIADRMRGNIAGAQADAYVLGATSSASSGSSNQCSDSSDGSTLTQSVECSAAEMAAYDLFLWRTDLQTLLPGGNGSIARLDDSRFSITVLWTARTGEIGANADGNFEFVTEVQL